MKGFATILVAASIFVIAILLLSNTNTNDISYNSNFSEMKVKLSNYEVIMLAVTQDCNWEKTNPEIDNCLNTKSNEIKNSLNIPYTICNVSNFNANKDTKTAINQITCTTQIDSGKEGFFSSKISKIIKVKKYP